MLDTAILHFHQQLRISIGKGMASSRWLTILFTTLNHSGPFQNADNAEYIILWIADLLNSGYSDHDRYMMTGTVVRLLGKLFDPNYPGSFPSGWVPTLLDFLSLNEKFHTAEPLPHPAVVALYILSSSGMGYSDLSTVISPILTSMLSHAHPLKLRSLALGVFHKFSDVWFSEGMENVPYTDLNKLLQAVGDPFQFPDLPLQGGELVVTVDYKPMKVVVDLIEFASADLSRNHLRRSNFISCEEILSTEKGRRTALSSMLHVAAYSWLELLHTPAKIIAAIKRLEELQCLNTAEAVILWAWTAGVVNPKHDAWASIECTTLDFYRTHGISRLATLSRHIIDTAVEFEHLRFLLMHYHRPPCRMGRFRHPVPAEHAMGGFSPKGFEDLRVAQACQLRKLYHLFGYDPTTWKEATGVKEVPEKVGAFSGRTVPPIPAGWACDYP